MRDLRTLRIESACSVPSASVTHAKGPAAANGLVRRIRDYLDRHRVCPRLRALLAQAPPQNRFARYDPGDIEAGLHVDAAQCSPCHGVNGDKIDGVDLRPGQFMTVRTDDDLARLLATGRPAAGMPTFAAVATAEVNTRSSRISAPPSIRSRTSAMLAARPAAIFSGQGRLRDVPSRRWPRPVPRDRPERHPAHSRAAPVRRCGALFNHGRLIASRPIAPSAR